MAVIVIGFGAVLCGFLMILFLLKSNDSPETPEKEFYLEENSIEISSLINMVPEKFIELMKNLIFRLGFMIEEMVKLEEGCVDLSVRDLHPLKGGRFIIHCICAKERSVVDSTDVINLLDNVKGMSALKGILITPHFFTVEALSTAAETQLELINGKRLIELLRRENLLSQVIS